MADKKAKCESIVNVWEIKTKDYNCSKKNTFLRCKNSVEQKIVQE